MTLMEAYRLTLRERVHSSKATAASNPTAEHMAAYGRAVMDHWANAARMPSVFAGAWLEVDEAGFGESAGDRVSS